jgi:hypothetical protein
MSEILEARIEIIKRVNQGEELSLECGGKLALNFPWENKHYCTLKKGFPDLKCAHLYNYSNFQSACLYHKPDIVKMYHCLDQNLGDW